MMGLLFWWPYIKGLRWLWLTSVLFAVVCVAMGLALLATSGWFLALTFVLAQHANLFMPSAMVRAFSFLRILTRYVERISGHQLSLSLQANLRSRLFRVMLQMPWQALHKYQRADLSNRLMSDVENAEQVTLVFWAPLITSMLLSVGLGVILSVFSPSSRVFIGIIVSAWLFVLPWGVWVASDRQGQSIQRRYTRLRSLLTRALQARIDIVSFAQSQAVLKELRDWYRSYVQHAGRFEVIKIGVLVCVQGLLIGLIWVLIYFSIPISQANQERAILLVGLVLAIVGFHEVLIPWFRGVVKVGQMRWSINQVSDLLSNGDSKSACLNSSEQILESEGLYVSNVAQDERSDELVKSALTVNDLRFSFHKEGTLIDNQHLSWTLDIPSFTARTNEPILISGKSGSGKTTFLYVLAGMYLPNSGSVSVGSHSLKQQTLSSWSDKVCLLTYDAPIFMMTVRENLLIANPMASDDLLWSALDCVGLKLAVTQQDQGLDAWVGETGWILSVGQARRLALARVLLSPAPVLLLDEPTASLDKRTEALVWQTLAQLSQRKILIVVSHSPLSRRGGMLFTKHYIMDQGLLRDERETC